MQSSTAVRSLFPILWRMVKGFVFLIVRVAKAFIVFVIEIVLSNRSNFINLCNFYAANAISSLTDKKFGVCRATRLTAICSNPSKIKSAA